MHIIANKADALRHIEQLYPIGASEDSDKFWLREIQKYGVENLPEEFLKAIAKMLVEAEGDTAIIPQGNGLMDGVTRE